jgi:hypothetical protein
MEWIFTVTDNLSAPVLKAGQLIFATCAVARVFRFHILAQILLAIFSKAGLGVCRYGRASEVCGGTVFD